jgi:hypothetical protein
VGGLRKRRKIGKKTKPTENNTFSPTVYNTVSFSLLSLLTALSAKLFWDAGLNKLRSYSKVAPLRIK